jgi:hypothetical protein
MRKRVTKERYWEMLEILPPAVWLNGGFLVGEPWRHNDEGLPMYAAFTTRNGRYYEHSEPMTVRDFRKMLAAPPSALDECEV